MKTMTKLFASFYFLLSFISTAVAAIPDVVLAQKKAVVTVLVYEGEKQIASGSGFIIEPDGLVVTNYHVISSWVGYGKTLLIKMGNGAFFPAEELIAADEGNDVALIKVTGSDLPTVKLAHAYKAKQGEDVVVIGSPLGLETTVSHGIISSIRGSDEVLQLTAPISPGSSGSPVFNMKGEVIGIATLIIQSGQNVNFAVPVKYFANLKPNLKNTAGNTQEKSHDLTVSGTTKNKFGNSTGKEWFDKAEDLISQNKTDEAIEAYGKSIALDPNNAIFYEHRAKAFRSKVDYFINKYKQNETYTKEETAKAEQIYEKAVENYSKAIELMPNNYDLYLQRAELYKLTEDDNDDDKAISDYSKARELMPNNTDISESIKDIYLQRVKRYGGQTKYDKAISDYTKLIEMKPNEASYYYARGNLYISKLNTSFGTFKYWNSKCDKTTIDNNTKIEIEDKVNKSYKDLDIAISINPLEPEYYYSLGIANKLVCNYDKAITINPKQVKYYFERVILYSKTNQIDNEIKDCTKIIELEPNSYKGYSSRGRAYVEKGSYEDAIKDFSKTISLDPDWYHFYSRANAYLSLNQKTNAKSDYEKACNAGWEDACIKLRKLKKDEERGDNWVYYADSKDGSYYYDKTRIKKMTNNHVMIWSRDEADNPNHIKMVAEERGYYGNKYDNYSYSLTLYEIDCQHAKLATANNIDYDKSGYVIDSTKANDLKFETIIPDSIGDSLYKKICKANKKK